jgi:hypothetical protein
MNESTGGSGGSMTKEEIKFLYELNANTNAYTDTDQQRVQDAFTTDLEVKTAYENNVNTNAYSDAEKEKLSNLMILNGDPSIADTPADLAEVYHDWGQDAANVGTHYLPFTDADKSNLDSLTAASNGYFTFVDADGTSISDQSLFTETTETNDRYKLQYRIDGGTIIKVVGSRVNYEIEESGNSSNVGTIQMSSTSGSDPTRVSYTYNSSEKDIAFLDDIPNVGDTVAISYDDVTDPTNPVTIIDSKIQYEVGKIPEEGATPPNLLNLSDYDVLTKIHLETIQTDISDLKVKTSSVYPIYSLVVQYTVDISATPTKAEITTILDNAFGSGNWEERNITYTIVATDDGNATGTKQKVWNIYQRTLNDGTPPNGLSNDFYVVDIGLPAT